MDVSDENEQPYTKLVLTSGVESALPNAFVVSNRNSRPEIQITFEPKFSQDNAIRKL